ncbi:hypothetical protein IAT38_005051 [Cryptococcus sp. DSM 104549]
MPVFRSSDRLNFNALWHFISVLFTFISFLMLMVLVFYNAPLDHVESTLEGKVGLRMWLITVNETGSNYLKWSKDPKRSYDDPLEGDVKLAGPVVGIESRAEAAGVDERAVDTGLPTVNGGLHAYGFGIWGWCEWANVRWTGNAVCTKKAFWQLPENANSQWDSLYEVELPDSIATVLSGASFLLTFAPFLVFAYLIILLMAFRHPAPYPPWPVPSKYPDDVKNVRTRCAWIMRDWRTQLIFFVVMMVLCLPAIVTVMVGRQGVKDMNTGLVAKPGTGFNILIGAWVLWILAQGLAMWKRGMVVSKGKKRSKYSQG